LYVHNSLILKHCEAKLPSFFDIDLNFTRESLREKNEYGRKKFECVSMQFLNVLEYFMKGFYDSKDLDKEIKRGHQIAQKFISKIERGSKCKICESHLWISILWERSSWNVL